MATEYPVAQVVVGVVRIRLDRTTPSIRLLVERSVDRVVVGVDLARVAEHRVAEEHEPRSLRVVEGLRRTFSANGVWPLAAIELNSTQPRVGRAVLVVGEVGAGRRRCRPWR